MENEWDGHERRNCNGCAQTNILEERRVADKMVDDERWEMLKRWGKLISIVLVIAIAFASLLATIVGGGGLYILKGVKDQGVELTTEVKNLGKQLSDNITMSAVTQQALIDHEKSSADEHSNLSGRIYEVEWITEAMWITLPKEDRKKLAENFNKQEKGK